MALLDPIPFSFDEAALMREAHVTPGTEDADDFRALVGLARRVGKPKAAYTVSFVERREGDAVRIGGVTFTSRVLSRNLNSVERVFPLLTTCGLEMDESFPERGDVLKAYWWDLIKTDLLFAADKALEAHLRHTYRLGKTAVMRPGSGDVAVWPIEQQQGLFALLGEAPRKIGVTLTGSFLMLPNKTASGLLFPTERDFRECGVCHRENCPSRQAPFDKQLWGELGFG